MFLSRVSIQRPVLATMMNLVLILFGIIGLSRLPVRELPDIDPPIVSVTTVYPGANAQVVETEVTERLEEQTAEVHHLVIGATFHVERRHRFGDNKVTGLGYAVAGLVRDIQTATFHEPQYGHVGRILADVRS